MLLLGLGLIVAVVVDHVDGTSRPRAHPATAPGRGAASPKTAASGTVHTPAAAAPAVGRAVVALPAPKALRPFSAPPLPAEGHWHGAGRLVDGHPAVYETELRPPGGQDPAGIAWMDTRLLSAHLYSGSDESPGSGRWQLTAPIEPGQASTLVLAFNGGFKLPVAQGGYYTQGAWAVAPQRGAASLVIYANGTAALGAWDEGVRMSSAVREVRQNLHLLVTAGRPAADAAVVGDWGVTVGGVLDTWRSALGITRTGALLYVEGPNLDPLQLALILIRAGAVRAMELDINPDWTILATYAPTPNTAAATPQNGSTLLPALVQTPGTFFEPAWSRDFITMSAAPWGHV